jgi:modulator of FtsH protease
MLESSTDFFVATAGASAALAGLVIVALSVSVDRVIAIPGMSSRAAAAIGLLVAATVIALAGLIDQPDAWFGVETIVAGLAALWLAVDSMVRVVRARAGASLTSALLRTGIAVVPALLFAIAGVAVLVGGAAASVILGLGSILAIIVAVIDTWVVLVEIKR